MLNASIRVQLNLDAATLERELVSTASRSARKAAGRVRDRAKVNVRTYGRFDTGAMMNSIRARQVQFGTTAKWEIFSDLYYATYQHEGVRPFGPRTAKVLRWRAKAGGGYIFSKRSSGFPPAPFLRDAADSLTVEDFKV